MIADTDPGFSTLREWLNSQDCFSRKLLMFLGNYQFVVPIHLRGICRFPYVCNFGITRATTSLIVISDRSQLGNLVFVGVPDASRSTNRNLKVPQEGF